MRLYDAISAYEPINEQEQEDRQVFLKFILQHQDVLTRQNKFGHFTTTAFIVNEERTHFVAIRHKIYGSLWMLPGGHADGVENLAVVAATEAREETGVATLRRLNDNKPFALQALPTLSHYHRSRGYVSAHTHYDVTYLFEVPGETKLKYAPDESDGIRWVDFAEADDESMVDFMRPVQRKLVERLKVNPL